jgi:hypothetical protein
MESTIEQTIAGIKARNIDLSIKDGDKIVSSEPLSPNEKEVLKENRAAAIALITGVVPETSEQAYQRGHRDGYAKGIEHAMQELESRPLIAAPKPRVTTPDEEIANLERWLAGKSSYYGPWEPEVIEALRATLAPGEKIVPMFAYSCAIIGVDGKEREFQRRPHKRKEV